MELRHMRTFAAVARALNFTAAAVELNVAQPAVSQTIRDLEEEMGVQLFHRTKRSVRITAAGRTFRADVERILSDAEAAVQATQRAARGEVGALSVGFMGPALWPILPEMVKDYQGLYPGVELSLQELMPDRQITAFREGRLDVGLSRSFGEQAQELWLEEELIYTDRIVAAVPEGHALAKRRRLNLKQLAREDLVLYHREGTPGMFDQIIEALRGAGVAPRVRYQPDQMMTVLTWVAAGAGIGLVPGCVARLAFEGVKFREVTPSAGPLPLVMVHRRGDDSPTVAAFVERVRAQRARVQKCMEGRCG